jgi:tetratricopeptide (TPR) repeat protein
MDRRGVSESDEAADIGALHERGLQAVRAARLAEAEACCRQILKIEPRHFESLHLLGILLLRRGLPAEAVLQFDLALEVHSDKADAHNNRGNALKELKRLDDAVASYRKAIALRPRFAEAHVNLANALLALERFGEALENYDRAIELKPYASAMFSRAVALLRLGRLDDALAGCDRVIALDPNHAEAHDVRGNILVALKRVDEALLSYDRSIALNPARAEFFYDRAHCRLLKGQYPEGWADHEWRWQSKEFPSKRPAIDAPPWRGQNLQGRRILVFREQGYGDIIQFARYLPLLRQCGADVTFLLSPQLRRLLTPITTGVEVISELGGAQFDFQCALMSLAFGFKTDLSSVPDTVPYLSAEPDLIRRWRERIGARGFKIGIAWHGNPKALEKTRFIPLPEFIPLARLPGVRLISLQRKDGLDQLGSLPADITIETLGDDFDRGPDAFIDTAAVMANLDLIISCDTSIPHLAGALGRPIWVGLNHVPDWRWLLDRDDSPWYPTARLFRQSRRDDWTSVFAQIERELRSLLSSSAPTSAGAGGAASIEPTETGYSFVSTARRISLP